MNILVIIGNGFDIAHGFKTGTTPELKITAFT